jgi:hypothetical protein
MSQEPLRPADAPDAIYGADGRPTFFQDPAMDRFVSVLLNLASELWVQTERVTTLSEFIIGKGLATPAALEAVAIAAEDHPEREAAVNAFMQRVFAPLRETVE